MNVAQVRLRGVREALVLVPLELPDHVAERPRRPTQEKRVTLDRVDALERRAVGTFQ